MHVAPPGVVLWVVVPLFATKGNVATRSVSTIGLVQSKRRVGQTQPALGAGRIVEMGRGLRTPLWRADLLIRAGEVEGRQMTDGTVALPDYDSLPIRPDAPPGSSWGLWGERDVLGTLNLLDEDAVLRGVAAAQRGAVFPLNLALSEPDPPLSGRSRLVHEVTWISGEIGHDEELSEWNTQSSSQWDGFRHIRHLQYGFYNGVADDEHGVHHWAVRGIVGRAVLVDV